MLGLFFKYGAYGDNYGSIFAIGDLSFCIAFSTGPTDPRTSKSDWSMTKNDKFRMRTKIRNDSGRGSLIGPIATSQLTEWVGFDHMLQIVGILVSQPFGSDLAYLKCDC